MAAEGAMKVEVEPVCPVDPSPELENKAPSVPEEKSAEDTKALSVVEKSIEPHEVENKAPSVPEEKSAEDTKALPVVEKSVEPHGEKPAEGSVHRDAVLARVATEKKDALIKAWEESEKSKVENRTQKKLAAIGAWENSKKAELEAELKKIEEDLEKRKAKYVEKMKNKMALLHKTAEEKRALTEAKRGEDILKAEEIAAKCRATGATPKKLLGWFSS